jgi:hypothetical protein
MSRESHPVLWGSTYNAAENLPPLTSDAPDTAEAKTARVIAGYLEQSRLIEEQLFSVISSYASAKRSLIVEGVHLTPALMCRLSAACPSCIPFVIFISNAHKHRERFAVRSKSQTLDPANNKYIRFFDNIRAIQAHIITAAEGHMFPPVDNTNVDRSVSLMHSVIMKALRKAKSLMFPIRPLASTYSAARFQMCRLPNESSHLPAQIAGGKVLFDPHSQKCPILHQIYRKRFVDTWSSRRMLETIRNKKTKEAAISKRDVRLTRKHFRWLHIK